MEPASASLLPPHLLEALRQHPLRLQHMVRLLALHLDHMLHSQGSSGGAVEDVPAFVAAFRSQWDAAPRDRLATVRVEHVLRKAELQLAAHAIEQGRDASTVVAEYQCFVEQNAPLLFDSLFEWIHCSIEDDLYTAQHFYFNTLDFSPVATALERHRQRYLDILRVVKDHDPADTNTRDALLAQLTGTLGQALGFLASMPGESAPAERLREAARLLREDLDLLHPGSDLWIQGVSYLVALYWRTGELDRALRWFAESLRHPTRLTVSDLALLDGTEALVPPEHPQHRWLLLNQLRLCALAVQRGELILEARRCREALARWCAAARPGYPDNLVVKWLLVLAAPLHGLAAETLYQLERLLARPRGAPILELMRAVELSLLAAFSIGDAQRHLGSARDILREVRSFGRFGTFLDACAWAAAVDSNDVGGFTPYEIATVLPYYYA